MAKEMTPQQIVYSEFVSAFRAYKQRKHKWQEAMQEKLAQEEKYHRL